jgi:hypothetical protein
LRELGIEWIAAHSPQAKGRIERLFGTLQDRLVKEMRLAGIDSIAAANLFLETRFLPEWEQRFTVQPRALGQLMGKHIQNFEWEERFHRLRRCCRASYRCWRWEELAVLLPEQGNMPLAAEQFAPSFERPVFS